MQKLHGTRLAALVEKDKKAGTDFLTKAAAEAGATKTASGIVVKTLTRARAPRLPPPTK